MMISTNCPHDHAPYLRHNREHHHNKSDEGWTMTLKIAIPKPRHWLACSTGWIVVFIVYLSSTLWIGGLHKYSYLSTNSWSWNKFLPGPVTTFPPIRAVHDTHQVYEDPMVESKDPFPSSGNSVGTEPADPVNMADFEVVDPTPDYRGKGPISLVQIREASDPADSRTTSTRTVIASAPGPANGDGNAHPTKAAAAVSEQRQRPGDDNGNSRDSSSAPPPDRAPASTSTGNPPSESAVSETKAEPAKVDIRPQTPAVRKSEVEPVIRATSIKGRKAVEAFRNYFDCVSESGKWVYDPTPRLLPWSYVGERYLTKCDGYHEGVWGVEADRIAQSGNGTWSVREELKWVWQSNDTCPLQRVDRDELCRRLGPRRNIMVVGDSLNHGLSWSIMNQLITNATGMERFMHYERSTDGVYEMCEDVFGQGNGFKVSFVRNDRLSLIKEPIHDDHRNFLEYPWMDLVQNFSVQILLLNRGAHYENDTVYEKALRETFTALRDRYPDVQVIYRNTPPGHANCTNNTAVPPLAQRQEFGWDGVKWPDVYSWGLFAGQNDLARKIVEEYEYIYMDIDSMLALRSDGHPNAQDCLHYCLPGPYDIGVQLLYNMLPFL